MTTHALDVRARQALTRPTLWVGQGNGSVAAGGAVAPLTPAEVLNSVLPNSQTSPKRGF
jgi:hypothetical protein